jgi:putative membrane protein
MAINELRRITTGRLPKIALLALIAIPLLYGGLYLYANRDPYGRLSNVPAAVVVEDKGATTSDGKRLDAGEQVSKDLVGSGSFDWHRVSASEAAKGVRSGRYEFSVTLPADFSSALASSGEYTPRQGVLTLTTNDSNNAIAHTIASQVTDRVRASLAKQVGSSAADNFLLGYATLRDQLGRASDGANQLADGAAQAQTGSNDLANGLDQLASGQQQLHDGSVQVATGASGVADGANKLAAGTDQLAGGLNTLRQQTTDLPGKAKDLADGAQGIQAGVARASTTISGLAVTAQKAQTQFNTSQATLRQKMLEAGLTADQVTEILSNPDTAQLQGLIQGISTGAGSAPALFGDLTTGTNALSTGAQQLANSAPALASGIATADAGANDLANKTHDLATGAGKVRDGADTLRGKEAEAVTGTTKVRDGARTLNTGVAKINSGATDLHTSLRGGTDRLPDLNDTTRSATANTIADPVRVRNVAESTARTYGAGLAPFFMSLAAWIGGYVLFLFLRPLSTRGMAANQSPFRIALGGWLTPATLGVFQMLALFLFVFLGLRLDPAHPVATLAFMMLVSVTFIAMVHTLNAWLGTIGQFLGLVLMVMQLVSAGGTFPWQTLPGPLYALHVVLPMGYAVDALRHLMYGGSLGSLTTDTIVLCGYLAGAIALTTVAARRKRVWTPSRIRPELVL